MTDKERHQVTVIGSMQAKIPSWIRYHLDDEQIAVLAARCGVACDLFQLRSADLVMGWTAR